MPKKILLMAHDVTLAHLGRPLQLAHYLQEAGHQVILAASADSARFLHDFPGQTHLLKPTGKAKFIDNLAKGRPVFDFSTLLQYAEEDEQVLSTYRPDMVIGDFRITLSISARRLHIPYATITNAYWSPAFSPRFVVPDLPMVRYLGIGLSQLLFDIARPFAFAYHCRPMNALRSHYGLPSLGHDLRNIYTDADLALFSDIPEVYGLDADLPDSIFLGPIQWAPDLPLPPWWDELDVGRPIIYLTLGSSGDENSLPEIVRQLTSTDAQIMVATAGAKHLPSHPRIFSAEYLPGTLAAKRADLVVCNGGSPTSYQAIACGTPVLGIPRNLDQFLNMHYLEKNGLGSIIRNDALVRGQLGMLAKQMLAAPELASNASAFARIISRYNPGTQLSTAIRTLIP
ncbi:MAG: glycosyl transferase family 1 [Proteobacteria bacterium]|nr:glycosyl transferase family 1 [Pseudomonadota bacterium]